MKGDKIIVEPHHIKAAEQVIELMLSQITSSEGKYTMTVAGESGSGKSETATAISDILETKGIKTVILQQDDYYVYPPKTNDLTRRKDIGWIGMNEVKLDVIDNNLRDFIDGKKEIEKPLVIYEENRITSETIDVEDAKIAIAEGTYTTALNNVDCKIFINRNKLETRAHREKRQRSKDELDEFTERVLEIEHEIISPYKEKANIIISKDYDAELRK